MMGANVNNEWGQLKRIILGSITKDQQAHSEKVIDETIQDLNEIENIVKKLGVEIESSYHDLYPRDSILIIKDSVLSNHNQVFDTKNILKANNDILYLISNAGNKIEGEYLQNWLHENISNDYKVHLIDNINSYHPIDTTFVLLKEGLALVNPTKVNIHNMPEFLRNWDTLNVPEPYSTQVLPWLSMNILSINEKLVIVEEHQIMLMRLLKRIGIESIPIRLRHARTLNSGPRSIILDVERE